MYDGLDDNVYLFSFSLRAPFALLQVDIVSYFGIVAVGCWRYYYCCCLNDSTSLHTYLPAYLYTHIFICLAHHLYEHEHDSLFGDRLI